MNWNEGPEFVRAAFDLIVDLQEDQPEMFDEFLYQRCSGQSE